MSTAVVIGALLAGAVNLAVGALGAWHWYRVAASRMFWWALRAAQATAVLEAALVGALAAAGRHSSDSLFYVYALVPLAVGLVAEQLRLATAETVLGARGLEGSDDVRALPEAQQRSLVLTIVRREMGVMAASCLVVCFLELRAAGTAHGF